MSARLSHSRAACAGMLLLGLAYAAEARADIVIYIDPGHGGSERGADCIAGCSEKTLNLKVGNALASLLSIEPGYISYHTYQMLRTTDIFVDNADRTAAANPIGANVFLSIHHNGCNAANKVFAMYQTHTGAGMPIRHAAGNERIGSALGSRLYSQFGLLYGLAAGGACVPNATTCGEFSSYQVLGGALMPSTIGECGPTSHTNVQVICSETNGIVTDVEARAYLGAASDFFGGLNTSSPGSITASAVPGNGSVLFQWTDTNPSGGDPAYTVYRATDCRGPYTPIATVPKTSGFNYEHFDAELNESRHYSYYVTDGNCASAGGTPTGLPSPGSSPAAPTGLTATWMGTNYVSLSWAASSGSVAGYRVWRNAPLNLEECEFLESGEMCTDYSLGTTTTTAFLDTLFAGATSWYEVRAYSISNGNENYSVPANVTFTCGDAIVTAADARLVTCPGGDGDVLTLNIDLRSVCDPALGNPGVSVCAVKRPESTPGIHLWSASASGVVERDTLWATYLPTTRTGTIQHARISGCGTLSFDLVVNGQVVGNGVSVEVRSPDQGSLARGSVDRFDDAAFAAAMLLGSGPCWDLDWLGSVGSGDQVVMSTHSIPRDHIARALSDPNGGEWLSPGAAVPISWRAAGGDSARVTLSLVRTGTPAVPVAADIPDDGNHDWTVPATTPAGSTWRMQILHSAGSYGVENAHVGTDESDATFTILPSPVSDLIADAGRTTAVVAWSDPVQGENVAQEHEMRYMVNMPITNANFTLGAPAPVEVPGPAGTTHCVTIPGLQSCRSYYFGMRTKSGGVWSLVSNVASASTTCSGNTIVSCDFSGLMAGGGDEGGGESARPLSLAAASTAPLPTDEKTARENSVLGGVPAGMVDDLYRLPGTPSDLPAAPMIVLRVAGAREVEVDAVGLGVVDHPSGTEAIAGASAVLVGTVGPVERVMDKEGDNLSEALTPGVGPGTSVLPGDALLVQLGGDSRSVALVVESKGRALGVRDDSLGILVQRPDRSGGWVTIARINPRRDFDRHAIASEGAGTLRLVFLKAYDLRSLGRLGVSASVTPEPLAMTDATHTRLGTVDDAVDRSGGAKTTLAAGDTLAIHFDPREAGSGIVRSHFLTIRGSLLAATTELASAEGALLALTGAPAPEFTLDAARPNPSTGSAAIAYTLATSARTELEIYDVSGRRVRMLVSAEQPAGAHEQLWDGRDESGRTVPAGVYFYRLRVGAWQSERKLIVLQK